MRALVIAVVAVVVLIGGAFAWWKINYPTYTYRYRMTVNVLVDGKVHSGSSVVEVRVNKQPQFGSAPPQVSRVYGEAVFVDLGAGRNVIALLAAGPRAENVDYPYNVVPALFGLTFNERDLAKLSGLKGGREVPLNFLPTLVTFTDLNNPSTARVVRPEEFERVFGPSVRLRDVVVETTSEPITSGIKSKFPWWDHPLPWLTPMGSGVYVDNRRGDSLRWNKGHLKREY